MPPRIIITKACVLERAFFGVRLSSFIARQAPSQLHGVIDGQAAGRSTHR